MKEEGGGKRGRGLKQDRKSWSGTRTVGKAVEGNPAQGGMKREEVRTGSAAAGNETKKKEREKRLKQRGGRKNHQSSKKQKDAQRIMDQKEVMTHRLGRKQSQKET